MSKDKHSYEFCSDCKRGSNYKLGQYLLCECPKEGGAKVIVNPVGFRYRGDTVYDAMMELQEQLQEWEEGKVVVRCSLCGKKITDDWYWTDNNGDAICKKCARKKALRNTNGQEAKADAGKPKLSLVPTEIVYEIEKVRSYGVKKYKDPDNWKRVELDRYHQALLRHTLAVWDDVTARDKESGLLHLSHIATNVAFMLELMKDKE